MDFFGEVGEEDEGGGDGSFLVMFYIFILITIVIVIIKYHPLPIQSPPSFHPSHHAYIHKHAYLTPTGTQVNL